MHDDNASSSGKRALVTVGPAELTAEIFDEQGNSLAKMPLAFNCSSAPESRGTPVSWKPPAGLKGRFSALLRYRNPAFKDIKTVQPPDFERK